MHANSLMSLLTLRLQVMYYVHPPFSIENQLKVNWNLSKLIDPILLLSTWYFYLKKNIEETLRILWGEALH